MKSKQSFTLGVLGGLGPMSTVYFYELLTKHTMAKSDSDHIDAIISSRVSTPDRTAFILGKSQEDPLPVMQEEATRLVTAGADLIVIPCNTAHYFYNGLRKACKVPMLNIIEETVRHLQKNGTRTFGLLATDGTVQSGAYLQVAHRYGMECLTPDPNGQAVISSLIYDRIKQNLPVDLSAFSAVATQLRNRGCTRLVLGCTELSLLKKQGLCDPCYLDSLDVLAYRTILACGKEPIDFEEEFYRNEDAPIKEAT